MDSLATIVRDDFTTTIDRATGKIAYADNLHPLVNQVLTWGRKQYSNHVVDCSGHFDRCQTEQLRRILRAEFVQNNYNVYGSWRKGYELAIGDERVGVTNGHTHFRVYYRRTEK